MATVNFDDFLQEFDLHTTINMAITEYEPAVAGKESYILCADCGTVISSANGAGLCMSALP